MVAPGDGPVGYPGWLAFERSHNLEGDPDYRRSRECEWLLAGTLSIQEANSQLAKVPFHEYRSECPEKHRSYPEGPLPRTSSPPLKGQVGSLWCLPFLLRQACSSIPGIHFGPAESWPAYQQQCPTADPEQISDPPKSPSCGLTKPLSGHQAYLLPGQSTSVSTTPW